MERQHDERLAQLSESRLGARRTPVAEQRRILLVGSDDAWRLLTVYVFEEMGYTVYAAVNHRQAVDFTIRLLPDVVVVAIETPDTFEILVRLSAESTTRDIPIVVLTTALNSTGARRTRGAGGLTLLADAEKLDVLVAQVDKLIAAAPHARRTLKRRLLDLQELARFYTPDDDGQTRLRQVVDQLQVAIFAMDAEGRCIAASEGATRLTGYSRRQLVDPTMFESGVASGPGSREQWRGLLAHPDWADMTTITTCAGEELAVHTAVVTNVFPGVHVVALATT